MRRKPDGHSEEGMDALGQQIRDKRIELGISQVELARRVGTTQATIDKIEHGRSQRSRFLYPVMQALGMPTGQMIPGAPERPHVPVLGALVPPGGFPRAELIGEPDLPVFASTEGGEGQFIISTDVIDQVRRPAPLAYVRDGYGVIITGESMVPAFRPGDIALVHPRLPPRVEDAVILFTAEQDRSSIKEYRGQTQTTWKLRRYRPKEEDFTLQVADWPTIHTVVGKYSRR